MSSPTPATRPLQPDEQLLQDLAEVEDPSVAERLERLAADQEIVTLLQLQRFDPTTPEWREVAQALAEYGYGVFTGWGVAGLLRTMAAKHGRGRGVLGLAKLPEGLHLDRDQARSLATEVTIVAVEAFRTKTLMDPDRTWKITGGASLKTYFVGRALMELPDTYRAWAAAERGDVIDLRDHIDDGRNSTDPSHPALAAATLAEIERDDPLTVAMYRLKTQGYDRTQIAEMTGTTVAAVRSRMHRLRAHLNNQPT